MRVPFLSIPKIEEEANKILDLYHPTRELPIPIDIIIDIKMGIITDFAPLETDYEYVDAYLSADFTTIYVNESYYRRYPLRYRFTLAHELGHIVLHRQYFENLNDTEKYKNRRLSLSELDEGRLETQANMFASFLLMPTTWLSDICEEIVSKYKNDIESFNGEQLFFWQYASKLVSDRFQVSPESAYYRIINAGIPEKYQHLFDK